MLRTLLGILIYEGIIDKKRGEFIYNKLRKEHPPETLIGVLEQLDRVLGK